MSSENNLPEINSSSDGIDKYFKNKKLLYFSDAGPRLSVFASQSVGMYCAWQEILETDLIYRNPSSAEQFTEGQPIRQVGSMARFLLKKEIKVNNLSQLIPSYDFVHCRGPLATYMAIKSLTKSERKLTKIIFDCRGLISEELDISLGRIMFQPVNMIRYMEQAKIDKFAVENADIFLTVSDEMSHHYKLKYRRPADLVIPTIVDRNSFRFSPEIRNRIRQQISINDNRLFLYVGGIDKWQRLDILGQFWSVHARRFPLNRLLILTRHREQFLNALNLDDSRIADKIIFDFVPYSKVPQYMFASDYGLMFRDDSIVNRAASPVKLSEYLASGLKVLTNCEYMVARAPELIEVVDNEYNLSGNSKVLTDDDRQNISLANSEKLSGRTAVAQIKEILAK